MAGGPTTPPSPRWEELGRETETGRGIAVKSGVADAVATPPQPGTGETNEAPPSETAKPAKSWEVTGVAGTEGTGHVQGTDVVIGSTSRGDENDGTDPQEYDSADDGKVAIEVGGRGGKPGGGGRVEAGTEKVESEVVIL